MPKFFAFTYTLNKSDPTEDDYFELLCSQSFEREVIWYVYEHGDVHDKLHIHGVMQMQKRYNRPCFLYPKLPEFNCSYQFDEIKSWQDHTRWYYYCHKEEFEQLWRSKDIPNIEPPMLCITPSGGPARPDSCKERDSGGSVSVGAPPHLPNYQLNELTRTWPKDYVEWQKVVAPIGKYIFGTDYIDIDG